MKLLKKLLTRKKPKEPEYFFEVVDTQPTAANVYTADNGGNITVTPSETVAPVETPVVEIPEEPTKPTPEKPSTPEKAPKTSVERPNNKVAQYTTVSYKLDSEPREGVNTPVYGGTLPVTGEKEGIASTLGLVVIAAGITALTLRFKKYNEGEEE